MHRVPIEIERSITVPARIAEIKPRITARGTAIIAVTEARRTVFHKRSSISSEISLPLPSETPRSPTKRPLSQSQYRTYAGSFSPSLSRITAITSSGASFPRMDSATSPGRISVLAKTSSETTHIVTNPRARRRKIRPVIKHLPCRAAGRHYYHLARSTLLRRFNQKSINRARY